MIGCIDGSVGGWMEEMYSLFHINKYITVGGWTGKLMDDLKK